MFCRARLDSRVALVSVETMEFLALPEHRVTLEREEWTVCLVPMDDLELLVDKVSL